MSKTKLRLPDTRKDSIHDPILTRLEKVRFCRTFHKRRGQPVGTANRVSDSVLLLVLFVCVRACVLHRKNPGFGSKAGECTHKKRKAGFSFRAYQ